MKLTALWRNELKLEVSKAVYRRNYCEKGGENCCCEQLRLSGKDVPRKLLPDGKTLTKFHLRCQACPRKSREGVGVKMYVEFIAGGQPYITEIKNIREIVKRLPLTKVPGAGYAVLGITKLRDRVVCVVDAAAALGLESDPDWQYMLVTNSGAALAVTDVKEVFRIEGELSEAPVESGLIQKVYLRGQDVLPVVDVEKIIR